jgi:sigma-E factor negative regulatory protein RseB
VFLQSLVVFLLMLSVVYADDKQLTPHAWLENMSRAMKSLNYQGTVIFMKNGQLDTMKYRHSVDHGIEQERLSSLNSPLREITRKSSEVSCLFKETSQKIINHHPIDSSLIVNLPPVSENPEQLYTLTLLSKESVAMLPAQIINIQPKDQFRYPRKIWIESQHYLPLKVEVYTADGMILEQVVFTDLQVESANENNGADSDDPHLQVKHIHATQAEPFENAPFILKNWPSGFKTLFFIRNSMQQSQKAVDHLLISDGFSSVSIYLEPKEGNGVQGLNTLGAVNSFSRVINDFQVTVLGEVPAKTVEFIADGVGLR